MVLGMETENAGNAEIKQETPGRWERKRVAAIKPRRKLRLVRETGLRRA